MAEKRIDLAETRFGKIFSRCELDDHSSFWLRAPGIFPWAFFRGINDMKMRFAAAAAALVALSAPTLVSADDDLKYEDLVHCAATNLVIAAVLSLDGGDVKNKDSIETYRNQAVALEVVATVGLKKDVEVVKADVDADSTLIVNNMSDAVKNKAFIDNDVTKCLTMGKAAYDAVEEMKKTK